MYALMQWIGGIAIHWFYRDIRAVGTNLVPRSGPVLVAMNHQNAMVDAIMAHAVVPRRLRMTAKATIGDSIVGKLMMRSLGIIPLRRVTDEGTGANPIRNRAAFDAIIEELRSGGAILMFPEGKSHNEPVVAPLKTGLARAALRARGDGVRGIHIVPIGLTFESKSQPGTAVVAQVGRIVEVDSWPGDDAHALTEEIAERLGEVSLSAPIPGDAESPRRGIVVRAFAWWGEITHRLPIRVARSLAEKKSGDEGEPAMYTMTYGLGLILLSYIVQATVVDLLAGAWAAAAYVVSLVIGAYWAAYADSPGVVVENAPAACSATTSSYILVSSQLSPMPTSVTSGTESWAACSI